ncbi:dolichol-P-glucose transferase, partial [Halobium palmae]
AVVASHQTFARRRLGDGFAWLARRLLDAKLYDYQCGAKAITRESWALVRPHLYEPGFAWDVELVAVAGALDRRIAEVPVTWEDQPGSTVDPVGASVEMARSLFASRHRAKLIRENRLHSLLDAGRTEELALVDRLRPEALDE